MRSPTYIVILLLTLLTPLIAYSQSPETAHKELERLGILWSSNEFINRAMQGDTKAVELFLAAGMDPNVRGEHLKIKNKEEASRGETALMWAAQRGHIDVAKVLIDKGADVNSKDKYRQTALMWAAGGEGNIDVVKVLINKGADVNSEDKDGQTALMFAAAKGHAEIVQVLLGKGVDINTKAHGKTALKLAELNGHTDVVQLLKEAGAVQ